MTPLGEEIAALIAAEGPMPVSRFMQLALGHPRHGYYITRDPFGAGGDFVTAPEISQVFGELIGVWAAGAWQAMGRPNPVRLIELGPGRGTLIADLLRVAAQVPDFSAALDLHLVETSPALRERQRHALGSRAAAWHDDLASVPAGPTILIANEFLDALPIRQFMMTAKGWRERVIGLDQGRLAFGLGPDPVPPVLLPPAGPGAIFELCPAIPGLCAELAARAPVAALFIDYGHARSGHGDTLQAVAAHRFTDPLAAPGEADITAHVDFEALVREARTAGLAAGAIVTQRDLLFRLGLVARAEALARANPQRFETLRAGVERLIDSAPTGMGQLFKALVLHTPGLSLP